jgi:periplasmic divalent cation tolerance protein
MSKEVVIFITAGSQAEAEKIARRLVEEKLAACVNIVPGTVSVFSWEGKVNQENEVLLIVKSVAAQLNAVINRVKQLHSYQVPEIIALPIIGGAPDYLKWLREEISAGD